MCLFTKIPTGTNLKGLTLPCACFRDTPRFEDKSYLFKISHLFMSNIHFKLGKQTEWKMEEHFEQTRKVMKFYTNF